MHVLHDVPRYKYGNIQLVIFAFYTQQEPSNDIDLLIVVQFLSFLPAVQNVYSVIQFVSGKFRGRIVI